MAYDNDLDPARAREDAERDRENALNRERIQKETRERQHKDTLKIDLRRLEQELQKKQRDLGALKLEDGSLEQAIRAGKRGESRRSSSAAATETVRTEAQLRRVEDEEKRVEREIAEHTRKKDEGDRTVSSAVRDLETALTQYETEENELKRKLAEVADHIREKKQEIARAESGPARTEVSEARQIEELTRKLNLLHDEERTLTERLTSQTRERAREEDEERHAQAESAEKERIARAASVRKREHEGQKVKLGRDITELERKIVDIKREIG